LTLLVRKDIGLTDREVSAHAKSGGASVFAFLPLPMMRWFVLKNLEKLRNPPDIEMPVMPELHNDIVTLEHALKAGEKAPFLKVWRIRGVQGKQPLFFFIHGGGFMGGDFRINENLLQAVCDDGFLTAAVNYTCAPEAVFPQALGECEGALLSVLDNEPADPERIFLCGDSAGGNLAAALTIRLQKEKGITPRGQILIYPLLDFSDLDSEGLLKKGPEFSGMRKMIRLSRSCYLPDRASRFHPYASPMLAEFKGRQPDALLIAAGRDGLYSGALAYAEKLEKAGGNARCVLYENAFHAFINDMGRSEIADDAAREIAAFLKGAIA